MLINFTNHPSALWSAAQIAAAGVYGEIVDAAFPQIDPFADENEIAALADSVTERLCSLRPDAVLCQGEMTLSFAVTARLLRRGVPVLAACSERKTTECRTESGSTRKTSEFVFCRFRRYDGGGL